MQKDEVGLGVGHRGAFHHLQSVETFRPKFSIHLPQFLVAQFSKHVAWFSEKLSIPNPN